MNGDINLLCMHLGVFYEMQLHAPCGEDHRIYVLDISCTPCMIHIMIYGLVTTIYGLMRPIWYVYI